MLDGDRGEAMKVLVAGSAGMIGSNVVRILSERTDPLVCIDGKFDHWSGARWDLRDANHCADALYDPEHPFERVYHLADRTVGIGYSSTHHGQMLTDSLLISLNLLEAARKAGVKDYVYVSSSCVYPDDLSGAVIEANAFLGGRVEWANHGYAMAKYVAEIQANMFAYEYGMRTVIARPANVFGPSYDWTRPLEDMHVIPALIVKMLRGDKTIVVWGSGNQTRTFDYEEDTAHKIVALADHGKAGEAYNLGGYEVLIHDLVFLLKAVTEWDGKIEFDMTKPEGPLRKAQSMEKLCKTIPPWPLVEFTEALGRTVDAARKPRA